MNWLEVLESGIRVTRSTGHYYPTIGFIEAPIFGITGPLTQPYKKIDINEDGTLYDPLSPMPEKYRCTIRIGRSPAQYLIKLSTRDFINRVIFFYDLKHTQNYIDVLKNG